MIGSESVIEELSQASESAQAESLKDGHDALKAFTDATQHSEVGATGGGNTAGGGTGNAMMGTRQHTARVAWELVAYFDQV